MHDYLLSKPQAQHLFNWRKNLKITDLRYNPSKANAETLNLGSTQ